MSAHELFDRILTATVAQMQVDDDRIGPNLGNLGESIGDAAGQAQNGDVTISLEHLEKLGALWRISFDDDHPDGPVPSLDHALTPSSRLTAASSPASSKPLFTM